MGPSHRGIQSLVAAGKPVALALALALTFAACAAIDAPPRVAALLHDDWFAPAAGGTDAHAVFEMSDAMRRYAERELADPARAGSDRRSALIEAFTRAQGGLRLAYDAAVTRTASEAYAERAGNCLSLVILTASFAKYLDLPVQYQSVLADEDYSHRGDLFVAAGHVNIMLGSRANRIDGRGSSWLTIDFAPPADIEQERSVPIDEQTVVAMFMNNRAAEALAAGRVHEAYWWARDAVRADAGFAAGINTLGVVYQRAGHPAEAEQALRSVLALESDNVSALSLVSGICAALTLIPPASAQSAPDSASVDIPAAVRTPATDVSIEKVASGNELKVIVTNTGPDAITGLVVKEKVGIGRACPAANRVTITGSGVPAGAYTIADLIGPGIALDRLSSGQTATLSFSCQVK